MSKSAGILEVSATITERGQTTVPAAIRKMLKLSRRDHVVFRGLADGTVVVARRSSQDDADADPALVAFLSLLAQDMTDKPDRLRPVSRVTLDRARALTDGVEVDLDAALPDDDA